MRKSSFAIYSLTSSIAQCQKKKAFILLDYYGFVLSKTVIGVHVPPAIPPTSREATHSIGILELSIFENP
jgi:hypothetical protein